MKLTYRALAVGLMAAGLTFGSGLTGFTANAMAQSPSNTSQHAAATKVYLIEFAEPGLLYFEGNAAGLRATSPDATGSRKLDVTTSAAVAYTDHLTESMSLHLAGMESVVGRELSPKFHYTVTHHGIALELTADEAAQLARHPSIKHIAEEEIFTVDTHRSAYYVGADTIWDGTNVPGGAGTRGQGITIGMFDTGANQDHPSFAPMGMECGYSTPEPKLVAKDCSATACAGGNPEDTNGHGSHTASTAGGNQVPVTATPAPQRPITGIAPCAKLITYLVCPGGSCPGSAITNAINQSIIDGIDVANFSLGPNSNGQPNPWSAGDTVRRALDMMVADIAVAMSAGNTRTAPTQPTQPIAEVKNIGPWVITVANSGHDANAAGPGSASVTAPTPVPAALTNFTIQGVDTPPPAVMSAPVRDFPSNQLLCSTGPLPPAGYFNGAIAAIGRGTCNFSEKVANAAAAGATTVLLYNNAAGDLTNIATSAPNGVSVFTATQATGNALVSFIASSSPADVVLNLHTPPRSAGGVLSGGSLRGPNMFADFTKPDITAPGTGIYAAYMNGTEYSNSSGTSMSSPQVAGGLALIRAVHPTWTPMEAISALMLTSQRDGQTMPDTVTPANPDGVGSGMMDLRDAARAGFVLDETQANFLAANPGSGGDPRTMNLAAVRNTSCNGSCSWTRTVSSTLSTSANWTASVVQPTGFTVTVSPSTFTLAPGADQTITITATPNAGEPGADFRYGYIDFASSSSPTLHFTVAVKGTGGGGGGGSADLMLDLNAVPGSVANGGTVNYLATVANAGPEAATGVVVELELPAGSQYVDFALQGENALELASDYNGSKGEGIARGVGAWDCGATGVDVTCEFSGTLGSGSMAPALTIETTINAAGPGTYEASGTVSADQTDTNQANNTDTVEIEVTGLADLIFADGFEDSTPVGPVCLDVTGAQGNGAVGDPANTVINLNIGAGNEVTGVAADIVLEAFDPSWLAEAQVLYGSTSLGQIQLGPSETEDSGVESYSTEGIIVLADLGLANITVDADGILKVEFRETFDDSTVTPDSEWSNLTPAAVCPGMYFQCLDQAACDAAVAAANSR